MSKVLLMLYILKTINLKNKCCKWKFDLILHHIDGIFSIFKSKNFSNKEKIVIFRFKVVLIKFTLWLCGLKHTPFFNCLSNKNQPLPMTLKY